MISVARRHGIERLRARPVPSFVTDALQLAYFEGLSPAEIAERSGEAPEAVRNTLIEEMKKLRQRLRA